MVELWGDMAEIWRRYGEVRLVSALWACGGPANLNTYPYPYP